MSDLKGSGTATPVSECLKGEAGAHQTPDTPSQVLAAFPLHGCGEKMSSRCGMCESGGGGWDSTDEEEGKDILHSFSMV